MSSFTPSNGKIISTLWQKITHSRVRESRPEKWHLALSVKFPPCGFVRKTTKNEGSESRLFQVADNPPNALNVSIDMNDVINYYDYK